MQYAPEHDLKELTYEMKILKYLTHLKHHHIPFMAYRSQDIKKNQLICKMK